MKYAQVKTGRKQQSLERVHIRYSTPQAKAPKDTREELELSQVPKLIKRFSSYWWVDKEYNVRTWLDVEYKNGGKVYDLYIQMQNSPLVKALL